MPENAKRFACKSDTKALFKHTEHWVSKIEVMTRNHRTGEVIQFAVQTMDHLTKNEELHCLSIFSGHQVEVKYSFKDPNIKAIFLQPTLDTYQTIQTVVENGDHHDLYFYVPRGNCPMPGTEPELLYTKLDP